MLECVRGNEKRLERVTENIDQLTQNMILISSTIVSNLLRRYLSDLFQGPLGKMRGRKRTSHVDYHLLGPKQPTSSAYNRAIQAAVVGDGASASTSCTLTEVAKSNNQAQTSLARTRYFYLGTSVNPWA